MGGAEAPAAALLLLAMIDQRTRVQKDYLICVESTFFPGSNFFPSPGAGERENGEGKKKEPVNEVEVVSHLFKNRICYAFSLCRSDVLDAQLDDHNFDILP